MMPEADRVHWVDAPDHSRSWYGRYRIFPAYGNWMIMFKSCFCWELPGSGVPFRWEHKDNDLEFAPDSCPRTLDEAKRLCAWHWRASRGEYEEKARP